MFTAALVTALTMSAGCGCGGRSPEQKAKKEYEQLKNLGDSANSYYEEALRKEGQEKAAQSTVEWIKQQKGVEDAGVGAGCIWFTGENGVRCLIQTDSMVQ